jgi:hypothetical protein
LVILDNNIKYCQIIYFQRCKGIFKDAKAPLAEMFVIDPNFIIEHVASDVENILKDHPYLDRLEICFLGEVYV